MDETGNLLLTDCAVLCAAGNENSLLAGLHRAPEAVLQLDATILQARAGYFGVIDLPESYQANNVSRTCGILHYLVGRMEATVARLKACYPPHRVAVIIGTTTTGVREVEACHSTRAVDYHHHQELGAVAQNLADYCGFNGPNLVVSTACTSGSKVLGLARKLLVAGWCDAVLAGASESINRLTCQGFEALESYAMGYCKPFQPQRDGINIGEGGALFTVEKGHCGIALSGFTESSDAYHESAPDPNGVSAMAMLEAALADAGLTGAALDYINLHGTGTRQNDAMEALVIQRMFGATIPASSTKALTGHTLGAAGAVEAAICWLLLNQSTPRPLPPHHGAENYDPRLPKINLVRVDDNPPVDVRATLSTSFAFGGHNTALILTRVDA